MIEPPHSTGCVCEWCNAVAVAKRKKERGWSPIRKEFKRPDIRSEAPNEKPFINVVVPITKKRDEQEAAERARHPSGQSTITVSGSEGSFSSITVNGVPFVPTPSSPSFTEVAEHADEFVPHPERPKPKSSGCWFCEDRPDDGPLCGVCQDLVDDYLEWKSPPVVDI